MNIKLRSSDRRKDRTTNDQSPPPVAAPQLSLTGTSRTRVARATRYVRYASSLRDFEFFDSRLLLRKSSVLFDSQIRQHGIELRRYFRGAKGDMNSQPLRDLEQTTLIALTLNPTLSLKGEGAGTTHA